MANLIYNAAKTALINGGVDLDTDTLKLALVTGTYTPDAAHDFFSDITNEVTATGYTAGGATLANKSVALDSTTAKFDADDVVWTITDTLTARGAVLYKSTGTASTSPLLAYYDFGADKVTENGDFTVNVNADGLLNLA